MKNSAADNASGKKRGHPSITRRAFLKLSAMAGALVAVSAFWRRAALGASSPAVLKQPPLDEKWLPTSCLNCGSRCATLVRVVNGKAVKIHGNPLSRVSEGETCPRANIGLQVLYDDARITRPLKRTNPQKGRGVDPKWTPVSWEQALSEVSGKLKSVRGEAPHKLALFHGLNTISAEDILHRFAEVYGTPNLISGEGFENEAEKCGEWLADGNYTASAYDLENSNYILAFGAGILESQKPVARNLRLWGKIRRERPNRAKVVVIDPRYSVTAARADQWLPINPGTDGALAMAIASVIISEKLYDADFMQRWTAGFAEFADLAINQYQLGQVAALTGINAETIRQTAREFARTKPAIAWRGRGATAWANGSYAGYAIFCLNALVGSIDVPGGVIYQEYPPYRPLPVITEDSIAKEGKARPRLDLAGADFPAAKVATNQVADSILASKPYPIEIALGFNANFNMSAPGASRWADALAKVPYYVHIAPFASEMAEFADIILPAPTFLEEWAYDHCPPGSGFAELKLKQPVVEPLYDTRSIIDMVFDMSGRIGGTVAQAFKGIGDDAKGFVQYRTQNIIPWAEFQEKGVWVGPAYEYYKYNRVFKTPSKKFEFRSGNLEALQKGKDKPAYLPHFEAAQFFGDGGQFPLHLSRYQPILKIESGSQNYPWSQQMFLVMHGRGWNNFAEINTETARGLGIKDMDDVWVESPFGKLKAKARVHQGVHPGVVTFADGQGHYAAGEWQKGIGVNVNEIMGVDYDRLSGQSAFYNTRVRVYRA